MGNQILHLGLHPATLALLQQQLPPPEVAFQALTEVGQALPPGHILLLGEALDAPIRLAQEAYALDKHLSILLLTEAASYEKTRQALQFSPFVGPSVQCSSVAIGARLAPIVVDAMQRTAQRRSFAKLKSFSLATTEFEPQVVARVRADFSNKVLAEAPIGAVLVSNTGTILNINEYAITLFGRPEAEVLGAPLHRLFPDAVREEVRRFLADEHLSTPKRVFAVPRPEGPQYLEISVTPIAAQLALTYRLVILNDTTATTVAQQQTQADLLALKTLNADLDNFIYTASHDLKQPIANIEGLLLALQHELPAEVRQADLVGTMLTLMQSAIDRFKKTINDLTDVSKLQLANAQPAQAIDVAQVICEVKLDLAPLLHETHGQVLLTVPPGALVTALSEKNLRSVVYNLLSNAIKYRAPDRPLCVQVTYEQDAGQGQLHVQDNGLGLDPRQQGRLFGLFQRLHTHVEGTGLGLYMVKKIVENAGGTIAVRSELGVGSTFTVSFPG